MLRATITSGCNLCGSVNRLVLDFHMRQPDGEEGNREASVSRKDVPWKARWRYRCDRNRLIHETGEYGSGYPKKPFVFGEDHELMQPSVVLIILDLIA